MNMAQLCEKKKLPHYLNSTAKQKRITYNGYNWFSSVYVTLTFLYPQKICTFYNSYCLRDAFIIQNYGTIYWKLIIRIPALELS